MKNIFATIIAICVASNVFAGIQLIPFYSADPGSVTGSGTPASVLSSTNIVFVAGGSSVANVLAPFNLYKLEVAGSTALDIDLSGLDFTDKQYTFEVQCHMLSDDSGWLALPSTNICTYIGGLPTISVTSNQTVYISFRAESTNSLLANVWLVK